jgi:D-inositol-3-phosphate glycosyltransferase
VRIAMLSYHTSPLAPLGGKHSGGMNVYVRSLSAELARLGHQVDVFTRAGEFAVERMAAGARLISLPAGPARELPIGELSRYIPEFADQAIKFASQESINYDLIHAHYWMSGLAGMHLKQAWSVPMVLMFHTLGLVKNRIAALGALESDARIRGERQAMAAADQVVAATPAERYDLQWLYELRSERVSVIPPGVDLQLFHPMPKAEARAALGLPIDEHLLLYVGRIEALKGIDTLIHAVARLKKENPVSDFKALIIGGDVEESLEGAGGEMARLRVLVGQLGLNDAISFLGSRRQQQLPIYYGAADVLVMPSYSESFGMVALEAMACGRPVVASHVGGLAYLVQDGQTGFHVQEGNAQQMAARLAELLSDAKRLEAMGQAARREAEKYSWEKTAKEIVGVYEKLLTDR